jgi:hypothetical protein
MEKNYINSINKRDFLKFIISVRGDHCGYSLWAPKKPSYALDEVGSSFAAMSSLTGVLLITFSVTDLSTLYCSLRLE